MVNIVSARAMNLDRVLQCFYRHGDGFGIPNHDTKDHILSLLIQSFFIKYVMYYHRVNVMNKVIVMVNYHCLFNHFHYICDVVP